MGSSLCVARSLQSVVQTPPDTREEERERRREANKDDHTMERLEDTVCVCSHLEHISVVFMLIKVLTYSFFIISC